MQVARGVIGAVVTGHYPLNHHPARLAMEHLEQFAFGWKDISVAFSAFQSIIFIVTTIAVANVVCPLPARLQQGVLQKRVLAICCYLHRSFAVVILQHLP